MSDATPTEPADPDAPCPHDDLEAAVTFTKLEPLKGPPVLRAEIRAWCRACDEPVHWALDRAGLHPREATVEGPERKELRVPAYIADTAAQIESVTSKLWTPGSPR
jgi:hypothetical protein